MDKKSLALSTGIKQEDVIDRAWKILLRWYEKKELSEILNDYNRYVRSYFGVKRKLKNPVHRSTGKPLKDSTLYQLRCEHRRDQLDCEARKMLIKLFVFDGILGNPGKALRARLEQYFKQLEGETTDSRLPFEFLIKAFNELKEKNPGPDYKSREEAFIEQCLLTIKDQNELIEEQISIIKDLATQIRGEDEETPEPSKGRVIQFKTIDGGKKFEDRPLFTDQTPSKPA